MKRNISSRAITGETSVAVLENRRMELLRMMEGLHLSGAALAMELQTLYLTQKLVQVHDGMAVRP